MRPPNVNIGNGIDTYMERWWVIPRNRWFNIYLHHFLRSDDDRALHDHPWWNLSFLLSGSYLEHLPTGVKLRKRFHVYLRSAEASHRVELIEGKQIWTLFITGPKIREWGFWCPKGWKHHKDFGKPDNPYEIGPGCDD